MGYGNLIVNSLRNDFLNRTFSDLKNVDWLLDLGCGTKPYWHNYSKICKRSIGLDVPYTKPEKSNIDIIGRGTRLPFKNNTFDAILTTEVMDDIPEPSEFINEIFNALTPNGILIMTTPFLVPLYDAPYEFYRFTCYGLKYLLEKSGFRVKKITPFAGLHGVLLSFYVTPQVKFWNLLSKATKLRFLNTLFNPFILLFVYVPQKLYLLILKFLESVPLFNKIHNKLTYATKGYGIIAVKPSP